ncbi:hypothetical protein ILUMI_08807, partial [Ignelater luminosus]
IRIQYIHRKAKQNITMQHILFSWFDYILFITMMGLSAIIGIYFGLFKKQNTTIDYLQGGKTMKVFPIAMSLAASTVSGVALIGIPAEIYMFGTQYWMMVISIILVGLAGNFIYLPVFYRLQVTSVFEYLEMRFDKKLRTAASLIFTFMNIIALPAMMYASSLAFNQVTGINLHVTALFMFLLCIFYTTIGGVKAVVWADTLQFAVTLSTFFCLLIMGTISVGGLSIIWERAKGGDRLHFFNMDFDPTARVTFWNVITGNFFMWSSIVTVNQGTVQRFLAVPTYKASQRTLIIFVVFTIITKCISCFSGLIVYAKYYNCDPLTAGFIKKPDQIIPFYVMDTSKQLPGLGGLFVAGLCTTALSSVSTFLNAVSGTIYRDFVEPFMPTTTSERKASNILKLITLIVGLISTGLIFLVEKVGSILRLAITACGITAGPVLGVFTMGMLLPIVNRKGAISGLLGSVMFIVFVTVGNQIYIWNGAIKELLKPLNTRGCNFTQPISTVLVENITMFAQEEPFWLFRISFYNYVPMGTILTIIIGLTVSWFSESKFDPPCNPDLLSPWIHRFLPKSSFAASYDLAEEEKLNINPK